MDHLHQLLTQTDGIALRHEDNPVEGIGNQEDRQRIGIGQLHRCHHLFLDGIVDIDTIGDRIGQLTKLLRIETVVTLLIREEQDDATSPSLQFILDGGHIPHGMIGRLLTGTQQGYYIIAATGR